MGGENFSITYNDFIAKFNEFLKTDKKTSNEGDIEFFNKIQLADSIFNELNKVKSDNGEEEVIDARDGFENEDFLKIRVIAHLTFFKRKNDPIYGFILNECRNVNVSNPEDEVHDKSLSRLLLADGDMKTCVSELKKRVLDYGNNSSLVRKLAEVLDLDEEFLKDLRGTNESKRYNAQREIIKLLDYYNNALGYGDTATDFVNYDKAKRISQLKPAFGIVDGQWNNQQGEYGNCYLLNAFAYIKKHPDLYKQIIKTNANGDVTVTFLGYKSEGEPVSVTIKRSEIIKNHAGSSDPDAEAIELAYLKVFGQREIEQYKDKNNIPKDRELSENKEKSIVSNALNNGGSSTLAFNRLTGINSENISIDLNSNLSKADLREIMSILNEFSNDNYIVLGFSQKGFYKDKKGQSVYGRHAISIEGIKGNNLILNDPHDSNRYYERDMSLLANNGSIYFALTDETYSDPNSKEYLELLKKLAPYSKFVQEKLSLEMGYFTINLGSGLNDKQKQEIMGIINKLCNDEHIYFEKLDPQNGTDSYYNIKKTDNGSIEINNIHTGEKSSISIEDLFNLASKICIELGYNTELINEDDPEFYNHVGKNYIELLQQLSPYNEKATNLLAILGNKNANR